MTRPSTATSQHESILSRPYKTVTITDYNYQSIRRGPIDPTVTHVLYRVRGPTLRYRTLSRFPGALYFVAADCDLENLNGLLFDCKPVMPLLVCIDVSGNKLTSLRGIQYQYWLTRLICNDNLLPNLAYLEGAYRLRDLNCDQNPITDYSALFSLRNLLDLSHTASHYCIANQYEPITSLLQGHHDLSSSAPNYYMHDSVFQQSSDVLILQLLMGQPSDPNPLPVPAPAIPGLFTLASNPTLHYLFRIPFYVLLDCVWAKAISSGLSLALITEAFGNHMFYAQHLEIEHLFRYTVLFLTKFCPEMRVDYSEVTKMDITVTKVIRDNLKEDKSVSVEPTRASLLAPYLRAFYALAATGQHFDTASATISAMIEREIINTDQPGDDVFDLDGSGPCTKPLRYIIHSPQMIGL